MELAQLEAVCFDFFSNKLTNDKFDAKHFYLIAS